MEEKGCGFRVMPQEWWGGGGGGGWAGCWACGGGGGGVFLCPTRSWDCAIMKPQSIPDTFLFITCTF